MSVFKNPNVLPCRGRGIHLIRDRLAIWGFETNAGHPEEKIGTLALVNEKAVGDPLPVLGGLQVWYLNYLLRKSYNCLCPRPTRQRKKNQSPAGKPRVTLLLDTAALTREKRCGNVMLLEFTRGI